MTKDKAIHVKCTVPYMNITVVDTLNNRLFIHTLMFLMDDVNAS